MTDSSLAIQVLTPPHPGSPVHQCFEDMWGSTAPPRAWSGAPGLPVRISRTGAATPGPARVRLGVLALVLLGGAICSSVLAQTSTPPSGGDYTLTKQAIAGGAQRALGGPYVLTGTPGQALVDPIPTTAADYRLSGGFHTPTTAIGDKLFANGFEN